MHGDPILPQVNNFTVIQISRVTTNCSFYQGLKSFSLQLPINILMKIETLHLVCVSGDSTPAVIPFCNGRLGDKHGSRHSFDVSVKNKHWKSQRMTAIYSSQGCLKTQGTCSSSFGIPTATPSGTVVNTQNKSFSIFLSVTAVLTSIRQKQGSCCHLNEWWTEKSYSHFAA